MNTVTLRNITIGEGRPKICVPIIGKTREEILNEAATFITLPVDIAEWRVDWSEDVFSIQEVLDTARQLKEALGQIPVNLLEAISCGAVFMGANTYIGNAPNFMVKAISDENGVNMPSFFGYILWSLAFLVPVFILDMLVFFL